MMHLDHALSLPARAAFWTSYIAYTYGGKELYLGMCADNIISKCYGKDLLSAVD